MSYDFIVVGAGISGASVAYHLKCGGAGRVLLLDRSEPASGGTGRSAGIIRQSYSTPLLVRLAHASIGMLARAQHDLGKSAGFVQSGYCFVLSETMLEAGRRNVAMQRNLGIVNEWRDGASFPEHLPAINPAGIAAIIYEPHGGYADPVQATEAFVAAFAARGGEFFPRTPARRLVRSGDRITGVETDAGEIAAGTVVNAAGPWAKPLAESAVLPLPLRSVREQDTVWEVPTGRPVPKASICNGVDATYIRPLGRSRFIIGRGFPKDYVDVDRYNCKLTADDRFVADVQRRIEQRFPAFSGMRLIEAYAALYDVTPDWHPFVDARRGIAGYADLSGGSGHGFEIAPAIGREISDWLLNDRIGDDFRRFSHDRIAAGALFVQAFGGNRG
jgi:sarcosine oxidase, subunit beta